MVYYINSGKRAWKARLPEMGWERRARPWGARLKSAPTGNGMRTSGSPVGSALGKRAYREWDENVGLARGQEWDGKFGLVRGGGKRSETIRIRLISS